MNELDVGEVSRLLTHYEACGYHRDLVMGRLMMNTGKLINEVMFLRSQREQLQNKVLIVAEFNITNNEWLTVDQLCVRTTLDRSAVLDVVGSPRFEERYHKPTWQHPEYRRFVPAQYRQYRPKNRKGT